jgi:hypothetical protein
MNNLNGTAKALGHLSQELHAGNGEPWAVTAIGHGHEFDVVMLGILTVLLGHAFEALCTGNARVILHLCAIEHGNVRHRSFSSPTISW